METILKYIQENTIEIIALLISLLALIINKIDSKLTSYNQQAIYNVFLKKRTPLSISTYQDNFYVKVFNSVNSSVIPFDYRLYFQPYIGGNYRAQIFFPFDKYQIGTSKTCPKVLHSLCTTNKFTTKVYANSKISIISASPLFPYISLSDDSNSKNANCDMRFNRYYFYIELTDYCNNTQIWYMSFSLLLSNSSISQFKWKKSIFDDSYSYYCFQDINIVSPKDIIKNYDLIVNFNKSLNEIEGKNPDNFTFSNGNIETLEADLQLYEMKEYLNLLNKLNSDNIL